MGGAIVLSRDNTERPNMKIRTGSALLATLALTLTLALCGDLPKAAAQQPAAMDPNSPPPEHPVPAEASFFFDQLAPYGEWAWIEPHGWVWCPSHMAAGWRPYTEGHWVYADCGWTWVSELEWGWAPFHYGRWFFHEHRGWCWVPGSVWAPAWVTWHWGDAYCGWAPIPPLVAWETCSDWDAVVPPFSWCFVEHRAFRERHLQEHVVIVARNVTLLHLTRNVTHLERRPEGMVNVSVTAEQIERATGHPVRRFQIAEVGSPREAQGAVRGASRLNLYRPVVRETKIMTSIGRTPGTAPAVTFEQLRRDEAAHRDWQSHQAREREQLERFHESELKNPPPALSAPQLLERQQAEHRAFNEHVARQSQVFEHRLGMPPPPNPQAHHPSPPPPARSGVTHVYGR
jgi:hypothetical protein